MSLKAQDDVELRARLVEMIAEAAVAEGADPREVVDHLLATIDERVEAIGRNLVADLLGEILKGEAR